MKLVFSSAAIHDLQYIATKHVIFFTWDAEKVEVIRILHNTMDFSMHLFDDIE